MSFESEQLLLRMRRAGRLLTWPMVALALVCFVYSAVSTHLTESWHWYVAWGVGGALLFFFWLIPLIGYANAWVDLTTSRLVWRQGWFGQTRQEFSLHEIEAVENLRGGGILVRTRAGESMQLKSFSKPKKLAQAIREASIG